MKIKVRLLGARNEVFRSMGLGEEYNNDEKYNNDNNNNIIIGAM